MAADGLLFAATWHWCRKLPSPRRQLAAAAVLLSPGLLIVDHIHFQYNGFLLGILLLSLSLLEVPPFSGPSTASDSLCDQLAW